MEQEKECTEQILLFNAQENRDKYVCKVVKSELEWAQQLSVESFHVTRRSGTEKAYSGEYVDNKERGVYECICCGNDLFRSETKYESGTGWPSFYEPIDERNIALRKDRSGFVSRIEVVCSQCDAHLGHVFADGPKPTFKRYCINSVALQFIAQDDL